jgi:hypothetical protein
MNWYSVFYWLSVGANAAVAATVISVLAGILFIIMMISSLCGGFSYREEDNVKTLPLIRKIRNWSLFTFFFLGSIAVFVPSKKDMILIIAGGAVGNFVTSDSSARALPADVTKYLHNAIQEEMSDLSGKRTDIQNMTKEEIIEQVNKGNIIIKKD